MNATDNEQIHNRKDVKEKRVILRKFSTDAEMLMWRNLRYESLGRKFRRQHSVGPYILDFYCTSEKLAIELDGAEHFTQEEKEYDIDRTEFLNNLNIRVIRFENKDILENMNVVLKTIKSHFKIEK